MLANLGSWVERSFNWNRLKCPEILNGVEVGNANSQHKKILLKYLCRVNSQSLQTIQVTAGLEFRCRFLVF